MCGIAGIVDASGRPVETERIARMTRALEHRGPDDEGLFVQGGAALGHRRLSILDLSANGHQPMHDETRDLTLVYNGEVYNFLALRKELEALGTVFQSRSDTEVLLHGYRHWGEPMLKRLNGMFAFGLWDARRSRLLVARDRFGIKPLYWARSGSMLVFASEIKALLASGLVRFEIDPAGLHEYTYFGNALGERTLLGGVHKLLPGHSLSFEEGEVRIEPFWSITDITPVNDDVDAATQEVRRLLDDAVARHLISDVPVGVFLSGGIDSSAITARAAAHYGGRLRTYSVGFDFQPGEGELPKARRVAERYGTEHHELHLAGGDLREVIEHLVRCHDQPFGDAANIPLYLLAKQLKGDVKVVLQGDGGDEMFAGYRRYTLLERARWLRWVSRVGRGPTGWIVRHLEGRLPAALWPHFRAALRVDRLLQAFGANRSADRMALLLCEDPAHPPPTRILAPELRRRVTAQDAFARYRLVDAMLSDSDPVQRMLHTDASILLPDIFLEKVDRSTMAFGLEVRVPFLDTELASYALGLPASLKVRRGEKKWLLRRALRGWVDDDVLDAKKQGFGVPYGAWLRGPLNSFLREVLLDDRVRGVFDRVATERCIDEHTSGERNHDFLLYKALQLGLWHGAYLSGGGS